ncbi:DUF3418 domain-containing protein, partial [Acinetobacter gyllenbergii]|uniref:DUF3418 domain-containing protein n=1 Tax=Acinetobacter gyllenbergii TaxID=134534 RepID=UPI003AF66992
IKQHREGVIRLVHMQVGDLIRQLKKQISKPLALAYSPLGDRAKLEQMLVYATLQISIQELPKNATEFQQLLTETKKHFLANGQQTLTDLTEIFTQWQQIRRELLV